MSGKHRRPGGSLGGNLFGHVWADEKPNIKIKSSIAVFIFNKKFLNGKITAANLQMTTKSSVRPGDLILNLKGL